MEAVDLIGVPVVDNHCHGIATNQAFADIVAWRRAFTESTDAGMPREHVATTALYRRLIRTVAPFLDCEPGEDAVFAARTARDGRELTAELLQAANIDTLLLDTGFPPPEEVFPVPELGELANCRAEPMLRLEILMEKLLAENDTLADTEEETSEDRSCGWCEPMQEGFRDVCRVSTTVRTTYEPDNIGGYLAYAERSIEFELSSSSDRHHDRV